MGQNPVGYKINGLAITTANLIIMYTENNIKDLHKKEIEEAKKSLSHAHSFYCCKFLKKQEIMLIFHQRLTQFYDRYSCR